MLLDLAVYPEKIEELSVVRIGSVILFGLALIPRLGPQRHQTLNGLSHYIGMVPQLAILVMIYLTGDAASPYYAGISLVFVGTFLILRWRFVDTWTNAVVCLLLYSALLIHMECSFEVFVAHFFFVFSTGVFASVGAYYSSELRFREFVLLQEVEEKRRDLAVNNAKLKELDEAKTRFFANMSHELRTPLTLILGPIDQLTDDTKLLSDPQTKLLIDTLSENGLRLLRLINDLLDLARLDTDELPTKVSNIHLQEFVEGIARSIGAMAQTKQIKIVVNCDLENHPVQPFDQDRLERIFLNLTINALKFSEPGTQVTISLSEEDGQLQIQIRDRGIGISAEELPYIFERFWQGDSSTKRKTRGTGIGLGLSRSLTTSMGGAIEVESELGEGTTFNLTFPLREPLDEAEEPVALGPAIPDRFDDIHEKALLETPLSAHQHTGRNPAPTSPGLPTNSSDLTILIIDDEDGMRSFIKSQLEAYRILEASDGRQGLAMANQHLPDLIVLDYMMPEIDGIELASTLKKQPNTARIPIVLLTAHAGDAPRIAALESGVNDFLTKPFSSSELRSRVKNILSTVQFERKLADSNTELSGALEQLQEQEEALVRSEKLASLGQMSAGIVHEINNPLNYAKTSLHILKTFQKMLPTEEHEDYLETLADLDDAIMRVIRIVTDLRAFTRGDETVKGEISLVQVIRNAQRILSAELGTVSLEIDVPEDLTILGNDNQLCQAFVNLIQNAAQATAKVEKPIVKITAFATGGGDVIVTVQDNGHGIPDEIRSKIFDPFFTTKDVGLGMGLGLSLTMRIIESHDGKLTVESSPNSGTEFTIYFSTS